MQKVLRRMLVALAGLVGMTPAGAGADHSDPYARAARHCA